MIETIESLPYEELVEIIKNIVNECVSMNTMKLVVAYFFIQLFICIYFEKKIANLKEEINELSTKQELSNRDDNHQT